MSNSQTTYYYLVSQFITTGIETEPNYDHDEIFDKGDLIECRRAAINYYLEQERAINEKRHFYGKELHGPKGYVAGLHSKHSLSLNLVECWDDDELFHPIIGEDVETITESQEIEYDLFRTMGIDLKKEEIKIIGDIIFTTGSK